MKRALLPPILGIAAIVAVGSPCVAAAGPDGFAGARWGASASSVKAEMAQQSFPLKTRRANPDGGVTNAYAGALAGVAGELDFTFINDALALAVPWRDLSRKPRHRGART